MTIKKVLENQQLIINLLNSVLELHISAKSSEPSSETQKVASLIEELDQKNTKVDGRKRPWSEERRLKVGQKVRQAALLRNGPAINSVLHYEFSTQPPGHLGLEKAAEVLGWTAEKVDRKLKETGYILYRGKWGHAVMVKENDPTPEATLQEALSSMHRETFGEVDIYELPSNRGARR